jgi:hypothetical protein
VVLILVAVLMVRFCLTRDPSSWILSNTQTFRSLVRNAYTEIEIRARIRDSQRTMMLIFAEFYGDKHAGPRGIVL